MFTKPVVEYESPLFLHQYISIQTSLWTHKLNQYLALEVETGIPRGGTIALASANGVKLKARAIGAI